MNKEDLQISHRQIINNKYLDSLEQKKARELEKIIQNGIPQHWHQQNHRIWTDDEKNPTILAKKVAYDATQVQNSLIRKRNILTVEQRSNSILRQIDVAHYMNELFNTSNFQLLLQEFPDVKTMTAVAPLMGLIENNQKTIFFPYISHDVHPSQLLWFSQFLNRFEEFLLNLKIDPYDLIKPSQFLIKRTGDQIDIFIADLEFLLRPKNEN